MKPVELELVNIGPFTGTTIINFDKLGEMFLVTGKTGSGKTTIFDAITYALYGKLSGARSNLTVRSLRSDFCSPEDECRVRFDFMIGEDSWRVERCPPVAYINRKGKQDEHPDTLALYHNSVQVEGTKSELTERLQSLLTLTVDEFSRIVLLPQGEFAQFLRDNSTKRQETLMKLFPVSLYTEIQKQAKEKADALQVTIDQLNTQISDLEQELSGLAAGSREEAEALLESAKLEQEKLQHAVTEHEKALQKSNDLQERVHVAQAAVQREKDLQAAAEKELEHCQEELLRCQQEKQSLPEKQEELKLFEQAVFRLETLMPKSDTYWETKDRYRDMAAKLDDAKRALSGLQKEEADLMARLAATADAKDHLVTLTEDRAKVAAHKQRLQDIIAGCTSLSTALSSLQKAQTALSEATHASELKQAVLQDYERIKEDERLHWAMGELTATLEDGKPCPVCGSLHHPSPANVTGTITTDEKLQAARKEAEEAQQEYQKAVLAENSARTAAEGTLESLKHTAELVAGFTLEHASQMLPGLKQQFESELEEVLQKERQLLKERQAAEIQAGTWETSQATLTATRAELNQITEKVNSLNQELTLITSDGKAAKADITLFIENAQSDFPTITCLKNLTLDPLPKRAQLNQLKSQVQDRIGELSHIIESVESACQNAQLAESNARTALHGFSSTILQREQELETALQQLAAFVPGDFHAYQTARKAELSEAQNLLKAANDTVLEAGTVLEAFDRIGTKLETCRTRKTRLEADAIPCKRLSEAINGSNDKRLKLDSWILGMYLDQITRYASTRLHTMSEGRFTMHLKDTVTDGLKGRGLKGLDIEIDDYYTGKVRDPASLSGGETFMASLALALALTDVVQEGRGGVQLESLFIDEGFGSLDGDALESALGILDDIRGTRCVGIISHVSELYTRIPTHLEVEKTTTGSSATVKILE